MKKARPGMDQGNLCDGMGTNQEVDFDEDNNFVGFTAYRDLFHHLQQSLDADGYQLIATPGGQFCGFDVYRKTQPEIEDINYPEDFFYFEKVESKDSPATLQFLGAVKQVCEEVAATLTNKAQQRMWSEVYSCFADRAVNPRSAIAEISHTMIGNRGRVATLSGLKGYHKVVPQLDWFPKALQDYDPEDLLTLFPDAERQMMVLLLGRVMVGAKGTDVAEGHIDHTARSYGIVVGTEAGMGKSTFMGYIRDALHVLGYTTTQVNGNLGRFGWGEVAASDLAYIDDLTDDTQKALLVNNNLKSIVSNDYLKVEEKGMPAVSIRSTSVILGCTNATNYSHYIGMDTGSINRLNQLDTYNAKELSDRYPGIPDARIKPYWEQKAKDFGVSTRTLAARLLQHCTTVFLNTIGYSFDQHGLLKKNLKADSLEATSKALRKMFRIDVSLHHADELPILISRMTALAIAGELNPTKRQQLLSNLEVTDFSPDLLMTLVEFFVSAQKLPECYADLTPVHLSLDCKRYLKDKLSDIKRLSASQSVEKAFSFVVGELKSNKGFGYPSRSSHYQQLWMQEKRQVLSMVESYTEIAAKTPPEGALEAALDDIRKHLRNITQ